ncbi:hypothetical protein BJF78_12035 [Pseudonocardia sp. CNS-139]|nr:hypothetical protein BJF78_12035 [Pseudonocardia sp. CNS-139]
MTVTSVIAVVNVADFTAASEWFGRLLQREADLVPVDGIAEWQLAPAAWLQVAENPERAGRSSVNIGVGDVDGYVARLRASGFEPADVEVIPDVVKFSTLLDPEGNEVVLSQELAS